MPGNRAQFETLSARLPAAATHQISPISNRESKLLETPVSYRKQKRHSVLIGRNFTFSIRPFCLLTPPPQIRETMRLQSRTFRFTEGYDHDIANE